MSLLASVTCLLLAADAPADASPAQAPHLADLAPPAECSMEDAVRWPEPPFHAWVTTDTANVRKEPVMGAHAVGLLHRGDQVEITGCVPDCNAEAAWGLLGPHGAIRLDVLALPPSAQRATTEDTRYLRAKVKGPWTRVYRRPSMRSRVIGRHRGGRVLAFLDNAALLEKGWLEHISGGFIHKSRVVFPVASTLEGEVCPKGPLVIVKQDTTVTREDGRVDPLPRHARMALVNLGKEEVLVDGGRVPRSAVAVAFHRKRPGGVAATDKWVHVDVKEQVLTAYEGDQWVYATLISSGKRRTPTQRGVFRVWAKIHHTDMEGTGTSRYLVEQVPHVLSFHGAQALHMAFWHDRFGTAISHGCVNLSPADARWLFSWAPPSMPPGWHTVLSRYAGLGTLTVKVERAAPGLLASESRPPHGPLGTCTAPLVTVDGEPVPTMTPAAPWTPMTP